MDLSFRETFFFRPFHELVLMFFRILVYFLSPPLDTSTEPYGNFCPFLLPSGVWLLYPLGLNERLEVSPIPLRHPPPPTGFLIMKLLLVLVRVPFSSTLIDSLGHPHPRNCLSSLAALEPQVPCLCNLLGDGETSKVLFDLLCGRNFPSFARS